MSRSTDVQSLDAAYVTAVLFTDGIVFLFPSFKPLTFSDTLLVRRSPETRGVHSKKREALESGVTNTAVEASFLMFLRRRPHHDALAELRPLIRACWPLMQWAGSTRARSTGR